MKRQAVLLLFVFGALALSGQNTILLNKYLRSNFGTDTMFDGVSFRVWGITNTLMEFPKIPASIIYCNEGDTVILNTRNISQGEHHTIHLHGLDVDTRNDGDPATSFWLNHMQDTTYTFVAHNAGTYLYHCHVADVVHVQMGMYGLIVVKAAGGAKNAWTGGPPYSKDYKWLLTEVDRSWHDTIPVHNPNTDTLNVPPYRPDYFLVNGKSGWELNADDSIKISGSQNEPIYLRLGNIMYFYNRVIIPPQLNAQIISSDGRPLPNAIISDTVEIMPGERYGVMLQASVQFNDSIAIQYIDMNTDSVWNTQYVQVNISGIYSVPEIKKPASISVFPNPSNDFITIKFTDKKTVNGLFSIVNILGENVVSGKLTTTDGKKTINISHLPSGTYFLNVQEENFSFPAARFIKID